MKIKLLSASLVASAFFLWLSGRICDDRAGIGVVDDAFFDADLAFYTTSLTGPAAPRPSPLHALVPFAYRPATLLIARALGDASGADGQDVLAARMLVAAFAALGIAAVVRIAGQLGMDDRKLPVILPMAVLATSNLIACVPESYGLSFGLLPLCASVILAPIESRRKAWLLAAGAVACGGTTITNVAYPGVALLYLFCLDPARGGLRPRWLTTPRVATIVLTPLVAAAAFLPLAKVKFTRFYDHIFLFCHFHLFRRPVRAAIDILHDLVFPVVAPYPYATASRITFGIHEGLAWTWFHVVAAVAWGVLLAIGVVEGLRDAALRTFAMGVVGWIGFNLLLHSIWGGPDHGLYMPHWSWALLVLAMIAARRLATWQLAAFALPILVAQVMTLRFVVHALPSLIER